MARLALYLTDEERDFVKARPRGWLRGLVQREMGSGLVGKGRTVEQVGGKRAEQVISDDVRVEFREHVHVRPADDEPFTATQPLRVIDQKIMRWKAEHPGKVLSPETLARLREEE